MSRRSLFGVAVPDEPRFTASPRYAFGKLEQALAQIAENPGNSAATRKVATWRAVLTGIAGGNLTIGSRTPVADTPAWVTLDVAQGGFATGACLAEQPLDDEDTARLAALPPDPAGTASRSDRERLNLFYLTDAGQAELMAALAAGRCRVDVPEQAALPVVAWLLDNGFAAQALDVVAELHPQLHRLRFTPQFTTVPMPAGTTVRRSTVRDAVDSLRAVRVPQQIAVQRETIGVWLPLHDRLVALWCDTVDGELPQMAVGAVRGGWPCAVWPADWARRRGEWLADYETAVREHGLATRHANPKSSFARLRAALEACPADSAALSGRDVGWVRRVLASTITSHGAPSSEPRTALRAAQAEDLARPTYAALAELLATRLDRYRSDGGIPSVDPVTAPVSDDDTGAPVGTVIPAHLVAKAIMALEAPVGELVRLGVIPSGEVLAEVLPQITARQLASSIGDSVLSLLYEQSYAAFRRRRSLLLLNLAHQVTFEELPWIAVLSDLRTSSRQDVAAAERALRETVLLALRAFPHMLLPNPLIRELGALAEQARMPMPLVEEIAADIFMGTFTKKWRTAAANTSTALAGTLYASYYDLPGADAWTDPRAPRRVRWGKSVADDFVALCKDRAKEAGRTSGHHYVAANGALLEQSQILTTQNLAVLVTELAITDQVRDLAPELAQHALNWLVRRLSQRTDGRHAALIQVKNAAYAWRQAVFFLSFADRTAQEDAVTLLRGAVDSAGLDKRFGPAVDGLAHVIAGGRFDALGTVSGQRGRRFLGWAVGEHWCA
jgi:hypothetical protein